MRSNARINRLAAKIRIVPPERCRGGPTMIVVSGNVDTITEAPLCRFCRQAHVLIIEEVIVASDRPDRFGTLA